MVDTLGEIDLRTQDPTTLVVDGQDFFNAQSNKERVVFRFISTLETVIR